MTSSISNSNRGWKALAVLLPVLLLGSTLGGVIHVGDPLPSEHNPVVANIDEALEPGNLGLVVMGSSVTMAGVDAEGLAEGLIPGRAVSLAHRGGQPAHWVATLRHRMDSEGRAPQVILLYVPLHTLDHGELTAKADRRLLVDLLTRSDPDLLERGLGPDSSGGAWERMQLGRDRMREALMDGIGRAPARMVWGEASVDAATRSQRQTPRDPEDRGTVTPGVPTAGSPEVVEPDRMPFEASFLPDLVAESHQLGARLVVVVPALDPGARKGPPCQYNGRESQVVQGLLEAGADVVDLSNAPIPAERFETRQHLDAQGREMMQPLIREALMRLELETTDAAAAGRLQGCKD